MPTKSVLGIETWVNVGPLTTTFTAPATCATPEPAVVGLEKEAPPELNLASSEYDISCNYSARQDCFPLPNERAELIKKEVGLTRISPYYSPAYDCPSGWTTVGAKAASTPGSGAFTSEGFGYFDNGGEPTSTLAFWNAKVDFLLGPDETMVICCPSGYSPAATESRCLSTMGPLSSYSYSTACDYSWGGTALATLTAVGFSSTETTTITIPTTVRTTEVPISELVTATKRSDYVVRDAYPMLYLIHAKGGSTKDSGNKDSGNKDSGNKQDSSKKGHAPVDKPNKWMFMGMPFLVAGLGAFAAMQV